jgi:hypothetical protein
MIEAEIRDDPVNPCVEGTFEPEIADVLVGLEKASW